MLVVKRNTGERIRLTVAGHEVWVKVTDAHRGFARIGIEAPADVKILREELIPSTAPEIPHLAALLSVPDPQPL